MSLVFALLVLNVVAQAQGTTDRILRARLNEDQRLMLGPEATTSDLVALMTPAQRAAARSELQNARASARHAKEHLDIARGFLILDEHENERGRRAIEAAGAALTADPNNAEALTITAGGLFQMGQYDASVKVARQVLKSNPSHQGAFAILKLAEGRTASVEVPLPDSPSKQSAAELSSRSAGHGAAPAYSSPRRKSVVTRVAPGYIPKDVIRGKYLQELDGRMIANGVSPEAQNYARTLYRGMLETVDPRVLDGLVKNNVYLVIIPQNKKLTDVPPFTALKGGKTFDGRRWETVRGVANVPMDGGKGWATAVGEENLVGPGPRAGGYPKGFTLLHEYGHMVHLKGLPTKDGRRPRPEREHAAKNELAGQLLADVFMCMPQCTFATRSTLQNLAKTAWTAYNRTSATALDVAESYDSAKKAGGTNLGWYADANDAEAFGQATAAHFGVGYHGEDSEFLRTKSPEMNKLMYRVYGRGNRFKK